MLTDYLPHFVAAIGICLAIYAWQRSVRMARSVRAAEDVPEISSNELLDRSHRRRLELTIGETRLKGSASRRRLLWIVLAIAAAPVLIASFYFDDSVARLVNDHPNPHLRTAGRLISRYGDWPEHALLGVILWLFAWRRKNRRWQRIVLMMILASILGGLSADVVRAATGRPRPSTHVPDGWYGPHLDYKYNAFPSGHTAASTAFFGVLLFVEWPIGALALLVPMAVGVARLVVGAHHFSDVVASVMVGIAAAYLAERIIRRFIPNTLHEHEAS